MKNQNYRVSRATVYNTLELLVSCDLITKHQFGKNLAQYEKSYGFKQHDHLICLDCEDVVEFCDPRIQQIKSMMGEILQFEITHHSLNLYGKCQRLNCKNKNKNMILDVFVAIVVSLGFYLGYSRGLIKTVFDSLSLIIGILAALKLFRLLSLFYKVF